MGLKSQESLLYTIRAEKLGLIHRWQAPNTSSQYNGHDGELLLAGKLGVNPELFDQDSPTFHVHKNQIGELVRKFRNAQKVEKSEDGLDYLEKPEQIIRLNPRQENNSLLLKRE